jgi:hypothetical protein
VYPGVKVPQGGWRTVSDFVYGCKVSSRVSATDILGTWTATYNNLGLLATIRNPDRQLHLSLIVRARREGSSANVRTRYSNAFRNDRRAGGRRSDAVMNRNSRITTKLVQSADGTFGPSHVLM